MSEKLLKILEEIKLGTRKDTYDMEITPEEYLSKDENGISFLEHLFNNNIQIYYRDEDKFKNNVEIGYLYCENNKYLHNFEFEENDLFTTVNDKLFIEFIAEKGKISSKMIKKVKNHLELVDIIISTNNLYNLDSLSEELVKVLTTKYSNGLYPIERYLNNENIYKHLIPLINDFPALIEICDKYNKIDWLKYANKNILMLNTGENETVLERLVNNKNIIPELLISLPKDIEFINFLRKNNFYEYLKTASEDVFLLQVESDKTLLEDIIEKGYKAKITGYIWEAETVKILNENSMLELVNDTKVLENVLLKQTEEVLKIEDGYNRTLLEYLLDNGYNPLKKSFSITNIDIIKILYNKCYYKLLGEKLKEKQLLIEIEPGVLIIDKLLKNNISIDVESFYTIDMAKKLYDLNRLDLLATGDIDTLLTKCDENNTYFDIVLEGIKTRTIKYSLINYRCSNEFIAKYYILIAQHDMIKYADELTEEKLLKVYNEKTLLEELLDLDQNLTLNKILTKDVKSNLKISIILKSRGIEQQNVDVVTEKSDFTKEYLDNMNSTLGIGPLYSEGDFLLKKLEELFMNDGSSDPELVSALIKGYRGALINNYKINIQELRSLVEVKTKNNDTFFYIKKEDSGYFSSSTGCVYCDDTTMSTILHETGHALHYYLTESKVPEEYDSVVEKIKNNPQVIKRIEEYSRNFNELRKKINSSVEQQSEEHFDFMKKEEDIKEFLNKSKEEQKVEFKDLGISEETLNIILDNVFTLEEYISHQKRRFVKENVDAILRNEFGAYISVGDIIDAIYDGDLRSGTLKNEKGEEIEPTFGHGISYYYAREHGFDEMFANFCMILKSKDCNEVLHLLKDILGDELYNMFSEFYYNNIVNSNETELEGQKLL